MRSPIAGGTGAVPSPDRSGLFSLAGATAKFLLCALIMTSVLTGCASDKAQPWTEAASPAHPWGHFSGSPITQWNPDGRSMTLLNELRYVDPKGHVWVAPANSVVDGASIPRSLWTFMGGPFEGKYRNASVLHDVSYEQKNRPWEDCDRMFYNRCRNEFVASFCFPE